MLLSTQERDPEQFAVPRSLVLAGGVFGRAFCVASVVAIARS